MIIHYDPDDYVMEWEHETCAYHKKHPGKSYAGCTCSGSITQREKTEEEKEQSGTYSLFGLIKNHECSTTSW